jgi:TRAP-type C4-dicarboxylate transport system permease large subunit
MILVIVAGATIFGHFLAITRIPFDIAELGDRRSTCRPT